MRKRENLKQGRDVFSEVFFNWSVDLAALMKGMLFHSVDAVTVNVRSPDLLRVLGMVSKKGAREQRRLGRDEL